MCNVGYKLTMDGKRCQGEKLLPDLILILNGEIWFYLEQYPLVDVFFPILVTYLLVNVSILFSKKNKMLIPGIWQYNKVIAPR